MTPDELTRLRELDAKASPAPWSYNPWSANSSGEVTQNITYGWGEEEEILIGEVSYLLIESDAEMIAESRNAIPALLAEIERLQQIEKGLKERFALIFDKWRSRRRDLIRRVRDEAWEEAWEEGYTEGLLSGRLLERTGVELPHKNPYKEDKK